MRKKVERGKRKKASLEEPIKTNLHFSRPVYFYFFFKLDILLLC